MSGLLKDFRSGYSRAGLIYAGLAALTGVLIGAVDAVFGRGLIWVTSFREAHAIWLLPFMAFVGLGIVFAYQKLGGEAGKGMSLIFDAGNVGRENIPKRLVFLIIPATWLSHLFGASVGREGAAVQIGGTIGHFFGKHLKLSFIDTEEAKKILLIAGMAAGFAGLFQTPIAATFFAIEVLLLGKIEYKALLPALVGAYVASFTSHSLGLEKFSFAVNPHLTIDPLNIMKIVLVGICFGLAGRLFAHLLPFGKKFAAEKLKNPYLRILLMGLALSVIFMLVHFDRYNGLGTNLVTASFSGGHIFAYDWILKLLLTVLSISAGFQGGEVTPLFAIGSTLGVTLAMLLGLPIELIAAAGYCSVFAAATNSYFGPIFIAAEVFGFSSVQVILPILTIAYLVNGNFSIYGQKKLEL